MRFLSFIEVWAIAMLAVSAAMLWDEGCRLPAAGVAVGAGLIAVGAVAARRRGTELPRVKRGGRRPEPRTDDEGFEGPI